jgi:hypothetical protein
MLTGTMRAKVESEQLFDLVHWIELRLHDCEKNIYNTLQLPVSLLFPETSTAGIWRKEAAFWFPGYERMLTSGLVSSDSHKYKIIV